MSDPSCADHPGSSIFSSEAANIRLSNPRKHPHEKPRATPWDPFAGFLGPSRFGSGALMIERDLPKQPLWYKDAVIYEVHVRAFHDSDGDGIGDFCGLTEK